MTHKPSTGSPNSGVPYLRKKVVAQVLVACEVWLCGAIHTYHKWGAQQDCSVRSAKQLLNPSHTSCYFLPLKSIPASLKLSIDHIGCMSCSCFSPSVHNHTVFYWPNFTFARSEATVPRHRSHSSHARVRRRTSSFGDRGPYSRIPKRHRHRPIKSHSIAALVTKDDSKPEIAISPAYVGSILGQRSGSSRVTFAGPADQTSETLLPAWSLAT